MVTPAQWVEIAGGGTGVSALILGLFRIVFLLGKVLEAFAAHVKRNGEDHVRYDNHIAWHSQRR